MALIFRFDPFKPDFQKSRPLCKTDFWEKSKYYAKNSVITCNFFNGGYKRSPCLTSGILFMPLMFNLLGLDIDQKGVLRVQKQIYGLFLPWKWPLEIVLFGRTLSIYIPLIFILVKIFYAQPAMIEAGVRFAEKKSGLLKKHCNTFMAKVGTRIWQKWTHSIVIYVYGYNK